ncbi:type II secretion system F family protein [Mycobacterium botniense]|uniref:Type II secretion system protein GspF domain-containing protein n=1 Tax=Mycobacterium botniense TaxID=84962 RepID=A0A7I9XWJ5_9MYCO|nr:type II secretion system F family protein [Mycobacterium botniense]GFG74161.1 hypothetical protein MBOT_15260 [Mycobacterium botniense]
MSGQLVAALLLVLAIGVSPSSSRGRIAARVSIRVPLKTRWISWLAGCAAVVAAVVLPLTTTVAAAVLVTTVGVRSRRRHRSRRAMKDTRALETGLDVVVGELRAGAHPAQAFSAAAEETDGAVAEAFRAVSARARLGADVSAGLRGVSGSSVVHTHWERLAVCWQLACNHGLAISTVMRTAQHDIGERRRFSARVSAGMAGARTTAVILATLPALGVALGQLIGAHPLRFLLGGHAGGWLLVVGLTLTCAGLLWSDRITDRVAR